MTELFDNLPELDFGDAPQRPKRPKPEVDCVAWRSVHCPKCGSADCPTVDSHNIPVRWHVCRNCGKRFKSIEENYHPTS